jgi:hypothetical protein
MSNVSAVAPPLTAGEVAIRLNKPFFRVAYAIKSRGIAPAIRAGQIRLYGPAEVEKIAAALRQIEARRWPTASDVNA